MTSSKQTPSLLRRVIEIDTAISLHLHTLTQPILPRFVLKSLEISGDGRLFFPIAISLFLSPLLFLREFVGDLLIGATVDLLVVGLLKHLIRRPRPIYNKNMSIAFAVDHWSFPSGHSSRVCFIAALVCLSPLKVDDVLVQLEYSVKAVSVCLCVCSWAIATSVSRVLLGRHFVCDVIAGACLGVLEALFVFYVLNYVKLISFFL